MIIGSNAGNAAYLMPQSIQKMTRLQSRTNLRAKLGDSAKLPSVAHDLETLYTRVIETTAKAQKLAADRTRSKAQQHMAARDLAQGLAKELRSKSELFSAKANQLIEEGHAIVERILGPRDQYGYLQSEIRGWIRENAGSPAGLQKISDNYKSNLQLASTIYSSPAFLLNLSASSHKTMLTNAVELYAPKGAALLAEGDMLEQRVNKGFGQVISDIHASYYNAELVAEAEASRVQV